jgi:hypothetical protein
MIEVMLQFANAKISGSILIEHVKDCIHLVSDLLLAETHICCLQIIMLIDDKL